MALNPIIQAGLWVGKLYDGPFSNTMAKTEKKRVLPLRLFTSSSFGASFIRINPTTTAPCIKEQVKENILNLKSIVSES